MNTTNPTADRVKQTGRLAARLGCEMDARRAMVAGDCFGVVGSERGNRMIDGAMRELELSTACDLGHKSAARKVAIRGARKNRGAGLIGWLALQIFIRVAVGVIVNWWLNREANDA